MKQCFVCGHNIINSGFTNKMLEDKGNFLIIKDVPSLICANCGEVYLETEVMLKLEGILSRNISELEIVNYRQVA